MSSTKEAYFECIKKYLDSEKNASADSNQLIVFQGFPLEFYQAVNLSGLKHLGEEWNEKYPDVRFLDGTKLLPALITTQGTLWCFYEEFAALASILNNFSVYKGSITIVKNDLFDGYYPIPTNIDQQTFVGAIENEKSDQKEIAILYYYSDYRLEAGNLLISYVNKHFSLDIGIDVKEKGLFDTISGAYIVQSVAENDNTNNIALSSLPEIKCELEKGKLHGKKYHVMADNSKDIREQLRRLNTFGRYFDVYFCLTNTQRKVNEETERYLDILKKYWGSSASFRMRPFYSNPALGNETIEISQGTIVADIIKQCQIAMSPNETQYSDIIVTAPTGAGKSIFFQLPGIFLHEKLEESALTIVICPLVALMIDQVKELNERGIYYATYINSAITYEERQTRFEGIRNGRYSIVYLSPELLLAYDIHSLIGERKIGLMVVDEAHLVTSWGRDFRVDYWFLGDYIEKIRRGSYFSKKDKVNFPVLCLTATAVYGGRDDVIGDLQNSLHLTCYSDHMYIGYVRRDNIHFNIRHPEKESGSDKEEKVKLTLRAIENYVHSAEKSIVYFPFTSQIEDVQRKLLADHPEISSKVEKYYSSGMRSLEKDEAYANFRETKSLVMMATKAFGMGVNISDVLNVYHFAPTGTLADYVQEIGRAARSLENGYAVTDYLKSDMHYAQTLWGLSGLRHYQIKAIAKKLYSLYEEKHHRNLLFSPETFSYLFDEQSVDMKVKSGLMLLSNDLLDKYHFKVITVRAKNLFSKQYIVVPKSVEAEFLSKYGKYCERMNDDYLQQEYGYGKNAGKVMIKTYKTGDVFEIDLASLWENEFVDLTFAQFKAKFFNNDLFSFSDDKEENVVPNMKLVITYDKGYEEIEGAFMSLAIAIQDSFNDIKQKFGGKNFTFNDFLNIFRNRYKYEVRKEYVRMMLDLFCYDHIDTFEIPSEQWKFIERRKADSEHISDGEKYCIRTQKYGYILSNLQRYFAQAEPNTPDHRKYVAYLSIPKQGAPAKYQQLMASILQLFDLASYEFIGGRNPQIFVRINDPMKLHRIAESSQGYTNTILKDIEGRHKRAVQIMNHFMAGDFTNEYRWEIIEKYFLGDDDSVDAMLGLNEQTTVTSYDSNGLQTDQTDLRVGKVYDGDEMQEYYSTWEEAIDLPQGELFACVGLPMAKYANARIKVNSFVVDLRYVWPEQKILIFETKVDNEIQDILNSEGWLCFDSESVDVQLMQQRFSR